MVSIAGFKFNHIYEQTILLMKYPKSKYSSRLTDIYISSVSPHRKSIN